MARISLWRSYQIAHTDRTTLDLILWLQRAHFEATGTWPTPEAIIAAALAGTRE